jgi:hypothetical protein
MTPVFQKHTLSELYVEDQYGGHLSERGNQIVAEQVAIWLAQHRGPTEARAHAT